MFEKDLSLKKGTEFNSKYTVGGKQQCDVILVQIQIANKILKAEMNKYLFKKKLR